MATPLLPISAVVAPAPAESAVGIYLHVPFCAHICSYCDFNTYAGQGALIPRYVDAMEREIHRQAARLDGREAATIYIGGGTPSLLEPAQIARLIARCRESMRIPDDAEISMETNPNSLDERRAAGYLAAGVNRVSLGVQTQQRRGLRVLGRQHEAQDAQVAFRAARDAGFTNINTDLIFGWPGQTLDAWRDDLHSLMDWPGGRGADGPDHFSLYSLIVEPGTPMAEAVRRGTFVVPDDDANADMYEAAIEILAERGWIHYEVANWARTGDLGSLHNIIYWQDGDFLGIGPGAFGTLGSERQMQHLLPSDWIAAVEAGEPPISNRETIDPETSMSETMMLGLRLLRTGVSGRAFQDRHGVTMDEAFGPAIDLAISRGLIERRDDAIQLTHRGLMLSTDVTAEFVRA